MTEMKAFAEQIAGTMNMEKNGSKKFRIWEKRKINGTVSFGIFSAGNGGGASPVVYLEPFYDAYRNGMPLEEITGQIRKGLDGGESRIRRLFASWNGLKRRRGGWCSGL